LTKENQQEFLDAYYDKEKIGYSIRTTIHSSDFSSEATPILRRMALKRSILLMIKVQDSVN
jgi:hypothetical protein